jgi:hypothetical protein
MMVMTMVDLRKLIYSQFILYMRGAGIALGYETCDRGSSLGRGWEFFSLPSRPDRLWGPPSLLSSGYQGMLCLRVKRPEREADHSPPSSSEIKNAWNDTSTPPTHLHGVVRSQSRVTVLPLPLWRKDENR